MKHFNIRTGWKNVDGSSKRYKDYEKPIWKDHWQDVVNKNWETYFKPQFEEKICAAQNCTYYDCHKNQDDDHWEKCGKCFGCNAKATDGTHIYNEICKGWWIAPMCHQCNMAGDGTTFELKQGTILVRAVQGNTGSDAIAIID